jgi:GrpB-like predicted nucleotidyltransferase (UPF0157 family)
MSIESYPQTPVACLEYDPLAPEVARLVSGLILAESAALRKASEDSEEPRKSMGSEPGERPGVRAWANSAGLIVEHIGSTAVPGCAGKGIIDLMLLYPEGELEPGGGLEREGALKPEGGLEHAKQILEELGFQHQSTRDPWPESRPMRLGAISYRGKQYRIHVHVISAASVEPAGLRAFRDSLICDADLRQSYIDRKRAIIASGVIDSVAYSEAKDEFISKALEKGGGALIAEGGS